MALQPDDGITRYLFRKEYNAEKQIVFPDTFLPRHDPALNAPATSVFLTTGLSESDIWQNGQVHVAAVRNRTLLARGDLFVRNVTDIGLRVQEDKSPSKHANIIGWPDVEEYDVRLSLAQRLARETKLVPKP